MNYIVDYFIPISGYLLAIYFYIFPRPPYARRSIKKNREIAISSHNTFPTYNEPDGSLRVGEHFLGVNIRNLGERRHQILSWYLKCPHNKQIAILKPVIWDKQLPIWIEPGQSLDFHVGASEIREEIKQNKVNIEKVFATVRLGDGSEVSAKSPIPLAD